MQAIYIIKTNQTIKSNRQSNRHTNFKALSKSYINDDENEPIKDTNEYNLADSICLHCTRKHHNLIYSCSMR